MQPAILTVLRSGGIYTAAHVNRLRAQCAEHAPGVPFWCLTDVARVGGVTVPMQHDWPGWWAKIEAFTLAGPILFMDLDTTVTGDLAPLLQAACDHPFIALRDFNARGDEMGSGLMAWSGSHRAIYSAFRADPEAHMARCTVPGAWGDQGFIDPLTRDLRVHWQDILPGAVVSWKKHCAAGVPDDARVICFHGSPKPWEVGQ